MPPGGIQQQLRNIGRRLRLWDAQTQGAVWAAALMAALCGFGLLDVWVRLGRTGRVAVWAALVSLALFGARRMWAAWSRRHSVEGVAVIVERAFPNLDNHLINYLQFAGDPSPDVFKKAYVGQGVPGWSDVRPGALRDRRFQGRALGAMAGAALLLAAPLAVRPAVWTVALARVLNPFSNAQPVCLTRIVGVEPGNATVPQGDSLLLRCRVQGAAGHRVELILDPADDRPATYALGALTGNGVEEFAYRIARATTGMRYRFAAGDDPSRAWYTVNVRMPPALTEARCTVQPPPHMNLRAREFDALTEPLEIPQGSRVAFALRGNSRMLGGSLAAPGQPLLPLFPDAHDGLLKGSATLEQGSELRLSVSNAYGETLETAFAYRLLPDRAPTIRILSPGRSATLPAGAAPAIRFRVEDDFGLASVAVERLAADGDTAVPGRTLRVWDADGAREWETVWEDPAPRTAGETAAYRVVAVDNYPLGAQTSVSDRVVFQPAGAAEQAEQTAAREQQHRTTLNRVIEMQRDNIAATERLERTLPEPETAPWTGVIERQSEIRALTGVLLRDPSRPLGAAFASASRLYVSEMQEAVVELRRVPSAQGADRTRAVRRGLALQNIILNRLTGTETAVERTARQRRVSHLAAALERLVKGESGIIADTRAALQAGAAVGAATVDAQDRLASDVTDFVVACRSESAAMANTDRGSSELFARVADLCESRQVKEDMLRAAERLETRRLNEGLQIATGVLQVLRELQEMFERWQTAEAEERLEEIVETLHDARDRLQRIRELQSRAVEAMRLTETEQDQSGEDRDLLEEEIGELQRNLREAMLQVPRDMHIYPELTVANEMVDDVYSIFEEVAQREGSEYWTAKDAVEIGWLKPDELIEAMKRAEGRIDDMEMWLSEEPDTEAHNQEAYDREEMPKMSLGALSAAAEDLIGDLLKETQELADAAQDSATNVGQPDVPPGWEVAEGPLESFGAQGKSGNQAPDHKEQSGRSNVGRQGQSIGETAAASGTIGEGDDQIEQRITKDPLQSGQIQVDGEADEAATGGGKLGSGSADDVGMTGAGHDRRMDSTAEGMLEGLEALMARAAALHVKASLRGVQTQSLQEAAHHMRQAGDAIAAGLPISRIRELYQASAAALRRARTDLDMGAAQALDADRQTRMLEDVVEGGEASVPAAYRDLVSEYFRTLNDAI